MMFETLRKILEQFQENYFVHFSQNEDGFELDLDGIDEKFQIGISGDEIILFGEAWHEHFEGPNEFQEFLKELFIGSIQIVTKYRGNTPVAHQLQILRDGVPIVISQTGSIFSPFWREKSFKTITYKAANKPLEQTGKTCGVSR